jgi:D-amino-acid dehydrogenase
VLIIGGGAIGAACAYYLTQRDVQVTLIDKGPIGYGCSYGNAGLILPSHGLPLPMPGALRQAAGWLLQPDSPLYIKPRLDWQLARWLIRFLLSANARHLRYAAGVLVPFAHHSLQLLDAFATDEGVADQIGFEKRGVLYVCNSQHGFEETKHEMELVCALGAQGRVMDAAELRQFQPAITGPVVGATWFEHEAQADSLKTVQTLTRLAQQRGANILPWTELISIDWADHKVQKVHTTRGPLVADQYVLATGSWTPQLMRTLKLRVPIQAGKGYSLTVEPWSPRLTAPLLLVESKLGVTPRSGLIGESVRLGGTMELAGLDDKLNPRRVEALMRGARRFIDLPDPPAIIETWRGLRPCTPDGLPIIGRPKYQANLILAAGHAMLGLTLAAGTGQLVADLITNQLPSIDPHPFSATRF